MDFPFFYIIPRENWVAWARLGIFSASTLTISKAGAVDGGLGNQARECYHHVTPTPYFLFLPPPLEAPGGAFLFFGLYVE